MSSKNAGVALVARFMGRQNTIPVPVPFVDLLGDYAAAAFLSQCLYWCDRTDDAEGWFHKTHDEWWDELRLTPDQVRRCTRTCAPYVESARRGVTGKTHYQVRQGELEAALQMLGNPISRSGQTPHQEVGKPKVKTSGKSTSSSTGNPTSPPYKTKTTAKTTADSRDAAAAVIITEGKKELAQDPLTGADRADAPDGADEANATSVTGSGEASGQAETGTATDLGNVPRPAAPAPGQTGAQALAALTASLAPLKVQDLIAEYEDLRGGWLTLAPALIRELHNAAREQHGKRYRGALIDALDTHARQLRAPTTPTPTATTQPNVNDLVRARIYGAKP